MSIYSEEEQGSLMSISESDYPEYHEYNQYYDYSSDKSADESYRNRRASGGGGTGKSNKFDDPGYNRFRKSFTPKQSDELNSKELVKKQNMYVEYYETSGTPHVCIRDAISGAFCLPYRTGTADEDLFFTVRLANGFGRNRGGANLFYDSPEKFERHFGVVVSESQKEKWRNKSSIARAIQINKNAELLKQHTVVVK